MIQVIQTRVSSRGTFSYTRLQQYFPSTGQVGGLTCMCCSTLQLHRLGPNSILNMCGHGQANKTGLLHQSQPNMDVCVKRPGAAHGTHLSGGVPIHRTLKELSSVFTHLSCSQDWLHSDIREWNKLISGIKQIESCIVTRDILPLSVLNVFNTQPLKLIATVSKK